MDPAPRAASAATGCSARIRSPTSTRGCDRAGATSVGRNGQARQAQQGVPRPSSHRTGDRWHRRRPMQRHVQGMRALAAVPRCQREGHRTQAELVMVAVVGVGMTLPLDAEPYEQGEGELTAGTRLLERAARALGPRCRLRRWRCQVRCGFVSERGLRSRPACRGQAQGQPAGSAQQGGVRLGARPPERTATRSQSRKRARSTPDAYGSNSSPRALRSTTVRRTRSRARIPCFASEAPDAKRHAL